MSHTGRIQESRDADLRKTAYDAITAYAKIRGKGNYIKSAGSNSNIYSDHPSLSAPMLDEDTAKQLGIDPQKHIVIKPVTGAYLSDVKLHADEISSMLAAFKIKHIRTDDSNPQGSHELVVDITQKGFADKIKQMGDAAAAEAESILRAVAPARGKSVIGKA